MTSARRGGGRSEPPALEVRRLAKAFGATRALGGVDVQVERGTVHALLGGNGSGKSTLLKVLAGVEPADAGEIRVRGAGHDARAFTPEDARRAGLRFVHQQSSIFPDLTVAENLSIERRFETASGGPIRWRRLNRNARAVLESFGLDIDPRRPAGELSRAAQTLVAIARALQDQADDADGVLLLDEPTACLPAHEVRQLLDAVRAYAAAGWTTVLVTHRLREVVDVADRATVLRDGAVVGTIETNHMEHDVLLEAIAGAPAQAAPPVRRRAASAPVRLAARGLHGGPVRDAGFELRAGELVGVAGLLGSGRSTLLRMLFGLQPIAGGSLELDGGPLAPRAPADAIRRGIAYIPEDRGVEAVFPDMSVNDNLSMADLRPYWRAGLLRHRPERAASRELLDAFAVKASSLHAPIGSLSGGNQQKVVLARWLRLRPGVVLLDEPTQGVDVGARAEIHALLRRALDAGACALMVSSDFEELALVADRILVLRGGVLEQVTEDGVDAERLERLAHGAALAALREAS